jgi:ABC-type Fe3+/spermidine/putrescine transport system ATPase subunit
MTVEQNIAFGLKQDKLPKAEITAGCRRCWPGAYAGVRQT